MPGFAGFHPSQLVPSAGGIQKEADTSPPLKVKLKKGEPWIPIGAMFPFVGSRYIKWNPDPRTPPEGDRKVYPQCAQVDVLRHNQGSALEATLVGFPFQENQDQVV